MSLAETVSPLHANTQPLGELEEAIRLHHVQLRDTMFRDKPQRQAQFHLGLAICYYRKAHFYSDFNKADVDQAIHFAHLAEAFYARGKHGYAWEKIQCILGCLYVVKADGSRAEHGELAIPYLENALQSNEALNDHFFQAHLYTCLLIAQGYRLGGDAGEKAAKIEAYAEKALEVYPDKQDEEWREYVDQLKASARLLMARETIDSLRVSDYESVLEALQQMTDTQKNEASSPIEIMPMAGLLKRLTDIIEAVAAEIANLPITDAQAVALGKAMFNHNHSALRRYVELLPPEVTQKYACDFEELIKETLNFIQRGGSPDVCAIVEMILALFYELYTMFKRTSAEAEECLSKARYHFEKSWDYYTRFVSRHLPMFSLGSVAATLLYFFRGEWASAERIYRDLLASVDDSYNASLVLRGKEAILMGVSWQGVALSHRHAYCLARLGRFEEAVLTLEKWRGRALNERLRRATPLLAQVRPKDRVLYEQCLAGINDLEAAQRKEDETDYSAAAQQRRAAQQRLEQVISRIRVYLPEFLAEMTFDEVRQAAAVNPLAYLLVTEVSGLILLMLTDGEVRPLWIEDFTNADFEEVWQDLLPTLGISHAANEGERGPRPGLSPVLARIGQALLAPLFEEVKGLADSLCLIPCGRLALLPLHAATVAGSGALLDTIPVNYAPSARVLLQAQKRLQTLQTGSADMTPRFIGIADPTGNLKNAVPEARSIADHFQPLASASLLLQECATKAALYGALSQATHLHFAGHGTFDVAEPLDAALLLAGDERLTLREILDEPLLQRLRTIRLVTLSACQTALIGYAELPEEVVGLPAGFLSAGVPGVIATLWPVSDLSTALIMVRFYDYLINDPMSPAAALRDAQKWLRQFTPKELLTADGQLSEYWQHLASREAHFVQSPVDLTLDRPFADPYYWAGFVCVGV